eukprot:Gb_35429 [translate_table: standard]
MVKGGKPFSRITFPKKSVKKLKKKYKSSQHQCKEIMRQLEERRLELERSRTEFVEALEEKWMEIARLQIEDVLRDYNFMSPTHDPIRSPLVAGEGGESQFFDFVHSMYEFHSFPLNEETLGRGESSVVQPQEDDRISEIENLKKLKEEEEYRVQLEKGITNKDNEHWRGEQMRQYQDLLQKTPYQICRNTGMWPEQVGNFPKAVMEIHEYYLKELRGLEEYLKKLKFSVVEWCRVSALANKIKVVGSSWIGTMYFPSPILQPFLKDIGKPNPVYQTELWLGFPHNSEATRGELLGGHDLQEESMRQARGNDGRNSTPS